MGGAAGDCDSAKPKRIGKTFGDRGSSLSASDDCIAPREGEGGTRALCKGDGAIGRSAAPAEGFLRTESWRVVGEV